MGLVQHPLHKSTFVMLFPSRLQSEKVIKILLSAHALLEEKSGVETWAFSERHTRRRSKLFTFCQISFCSLALAQQQEGEGVNKELTECATKCDVDMSRTFNRLRRSRVDSESFQQLASFNSVTSNAQRSVMKSSSFIISLEARCESFHASPH